MDEKEIMKEKTVSSVADPNQTEEDGISCPHIKTEIKTEREQLLGKSGGYLCPTCSKHFFLLDYFVKHVNEDHYKEKDHPADQDKNRTAQLPSTAVLHKAPSSVEPRILFDQFFRALCANVVLDKFFRVLS